MIKGQQDIVGCLIDDFGVSLKNGRYCKNGEACLFLLKVAQVESREGEAVMWYVIQTVTGKEEELLIFMQTILDWELYKDCFVIKAEWMKRLGGEWRLQIRPLFPGYIFIETGQPEELFLQLKSVPRLSKLLGNGRYDFVPVEKDEEDFLRLLLKDNKEHMVRLTCAAVSEDGTLLAMNGALEYFEKDILKWNFHKRYAVVRVKLLGVEKTVLFGVRLLQDVV